LTYQTRAPRGLERVLPVADAVSSSVCGLAAGGGWGVADYFAAHGARRISPVRLAFVVHALGAAIFSAAVIALGAGALVLHARAVALAAVAGMLMTLGTVCFYRALQLGPVAVASPVSSAFPLVAAVVSVVFGAPLTVRDGMGVVAVVAGVALASGLLSATPGAGLRALKPAAAAAVAWGVAASVLALAVTRSTWQSATLIEFLAGTLVFVAAPGARGAAELRAVLRTRVVWLAALAQQGGEAVFNVGLARGGSPAVLGALAACYPGITVLLAVRGLGERVGRGTLSGAVLTIGGVAVLSL
jgi:drug/metabolite transporter (DMT)-like permease